MTNKTFTLTQEQRHVLGALIGHTVGTDCLDPFFDELFEEFAGEWPELVLVKRNGITLTEVAVIEGSHDNLLQVKA